MLSADQIEKLNHEIELHKNLAIETVNEIIEYVETTLNANPLGRQTPRDKYFRAL